LEMELAAEYAPQNFYCYTLDKKAHDRFKHRMRKLASCFPNVIVSENEFNTTSSGDQINYALIECFKILSNYSWNYVITLNVGPYNLALMMSHKVSPGVFTIFFKFIKNSLLIIKIFCFWFSGLFRSQMARGCNLMCGAEINRFLTVPKTWN
jgi:hypothetical protein